MPLGTDRIQIGGEKVAGAAALGTMRNQDAGTWQFDAGVVFGNCSVVPLLDGAQINSGKGRSAQLQRIF